MTGQPRNAGRATPRRRVLRSGWDDLSYDLLAASLDVRHLANLDRWDEATAAAYRAGTVAAMLAAALDEDVANTAPLLAAALDEDGFTP